MNDWTSWLIRRVPRACACVIVVFLLNCPSELSLAQNPSEKVGSLIALEQYLNEECDVTTRKDVTTKNSETCGVTRLIPYKNDAVLKQRLLQILTSESDKETLQMAEMVVGKQWEVFQDVSRKANQRSHRDSISTSGTATSTMTKDVYSKRHLEIILHIYREKAAWGLATIDRNKAAQMLADADKSGNQVLAQMLRFALLHHPSNRP
jgi:hypothetical protein